MYLNKRNNSRKYVCQNCGNKLHYYKDCPEPKKSFGIILFKIKNNSIQYLMIRRRNTIGFVQFIRGQYINTDINYIQTLFNVMTDEELILINNKNFDHLWEYLWLDNFYNNVNDKTRKDKQSSEIKFSNIKIGFYHNNEYINIDHFLKNKKSFYKEPEWEFPKGRRNINESEFGTALREFNEETAINKEDINCISEVNLFKEEYKSYDNVKYKNMYFLCKYNLDNDKFSILPERREQYTEVSDIRFLDINQVKEKIRNYAEYKLNMIELVDKYIRDNLLS